MIFLLHGYGGTPDEFANLLAPVLESKRSYQSLSTDQKAKLARRGYQWYGFTSDDSANRERAMECASKLEAGIQKTIGNRTADLVGYSQGAMVALALALRGRVKIGRAICLCGDFGLRPSEPVFAHRVTIAIATGDPFTARHLPTENELSQNNGRVTRIRLEQSGHEIGPPALAWLKNELNIPIETKKIPMTYDTNKSSEKSD